MDFELFDANPAWRLVLQAYADIRPADSPWIARIAGVTGVEGPLLSGIHGKLIALGLLKFDLGTRDEGIRYQVTSTGRHALLPPQSRPALSDFATLDDAA